MKFGSPPLCSTATTRSKPTSPFDEVLDRVRSENLYGFLRPGVYVHIVQHCVANRPPNPARYRMLVETSGGRRRLFREGDTYDPQREGAKITPAPEDLPSGYTQLLEWYRDWSARTTSSIAREDPLLSLRGSGRALWSNEHADDYVRRLRSGWE